MTTAYHGLGDGHSGFDAAAVPAPAVTGATSAGPGGAARPSRWLEGAVRASHWIRRARVTTSHGHLWLAAPEPPGRLFATSDLYSGSAGVVLFLLELARATGEASLREEAAGGALHLARTLAPGPGAGLYDGLAGIGFVVLEAARALDSAELRAGALRAVELIEESARPAGEGVEWSGSTDIVSGGAGTALFLVDAARELGRRSARDLALSGGERLAELGIPVAGGLAWRGAPDDPLLMPNFSHGTAGVAYALATLATESGRSDLAERAAAGAHHLLAVADAEGDGCRVFHHEPGGRDLFYLSWCHGPAGTARLFAQLARATADRLWLAWVWRAARSIRSSGAPEQESPGYWRNFGRCCGAAGLGELFLGLYSAFGREEDLAFARRVGEHLLGSAVPIGDGLAWPHAEQRTRPEQVYPQTGLMQGAAGIGLFLLRLDAAERDRDWALRFPDEPEWRALGGLVGSA